MNSTPFTFDSSAHTYHMNGVLVPGCTGVLATGGLVNFQYVTEEILERKSELGREVHRACHLHNLGTLLTYDPKVKPYLHSWITFKEKTKYKPEQSEFQCIGWVNGLPFGMQIDNCGIVDNHEAIIELKIGEVYPHHGIQLAGYAAGLPHDKLKTPLARFMARKRYVVQLRESGLPKTHEFSAYSDFEVFASLLYVSGWKKQFKEVYLKGEKP